MGTIHKTWHRLRPRRLDLRADRRPLRSRPARSRALILARNNQTCCTPKPQRRRCSRSGTSRPRSCGQSLISNAASPAVAADTRRDPALFLRLDQASLGSQFTTREIDPHEFDGGSVVNPQASFADEVSVEF